MTHRSLAPFVYSTLLLTLAAIGCGQRQGGTGGAPQLVVVPVSTPVQRVVSDYVDYNGQTVAVNSVDVRARVTGYLDKVEFKEGAEVKKGDLLFVIDPRPYEAQVKSAEAQLALNQANYRLAVAEYERGRVIARDPEALSREALEKLAAAQATSKASVDVAKAAVEDAKLLLGWTKVTSPIDGQISRYYYTPGNLVTQDQTLLTTIVSLDPMYVTFEMDTPTWRRIITGINAGKIQRHRSLTDITLLMGLEGEDGYPHRGHLNFVNNQVNPTTGTLLVRGEFANPLPPGVLPLVGPTAAGLVVSPAGAGPLAAAAALAAGETLPRGVRLLKPGLFVRVRLPIGAPQPALLVIDRAIASDQGLKYVYVLDADDKVQYRRVTTGALQEDGLRVIKEGLGPKDRVVIGALQQVRPNMQVQPEPTEMPTLGESPTGQGSLDEGGKPLPPPGPAKGTGGNGTGQKGGTKR